MKKISWNFRNSATKIKPVNTSTRGYMADILVLQCRHLPRSIKKLMNGIRSYQYREFWQDIHILLPPKDLLVFHRQITTFKKLPIIRPKTKKMARRERVSVDIINKNRI